MTNAHRLRSLTNISPLYFSPQDPLIDDVLIPAFKIAESVNCMSGYFSSSILSSLAPGLATYIGESKGKLQLLISPLLDYHDYEAIKDGLRTADDIAIEKFDKLLLTEDYIQRHTLNCLSYLLRNERLILNIAIMKNALFHPKVWLFQSQQEILAVHGSSNCTYSGLHENIEQIAVSKSWEDKNQIETAEKLNKKFWQIWNNEDDSCLVISAPLAIQEKLLNTYSSDKIPSEAELKELFKRAKGIAKNNDNKPVHKINEPEFKIPKNLEYQKGPFSHQGEAVNAWCNAGFRGILEMATGSGKTITSMICAKRVHEIHQPLLIVIAAPYVPLIDQWCNEVKLFGLNSLNISKFTGIVNRNKEIRKLSRQIRHGISSVEVIVVSHKTLCNDNFLEEIQSIKCKKLLIGDEVHNLGSESFLENVPEFFDYRLGLSATPVRQYDQLGTKALQTYFGDSVFKFELKHAIGVCLVEYDYFVHQVELNEEEMETWFQLTEKIKKNYWRFENGISDEFLTKLLRDRRAILETAVNKLTSLRLLLDEINTNNLKHTLIYATDKDPEQLKAVNMMLNELGIVFRQLTAEETSDRKLMTNVINDFKSGEIQVLTAKRVLDEGVNIPEINQAFILASTTVERQWVQRRGRILRTCNELNKKNSTIHDFIALPIDFRNNLDKDTRKLIKSELTRIQEFATLARNPGTPNGALNTIKELSNLIYSA